ncbi:MAG: tripartite tricarboxylate transporter substrate binding protein [Rhizobiales bacterium]|nr:tripartite tricarboxylate transporter substrate binding protein [Hyphomicrobiales bacterium]
MKKRNFLLTLTAAFAGATMLAIPALAMDNLTIIAPAKPGGGWDQTARSIAEVMQGAGLAKAVTVENVAGAGGTVGLAQFADKNKGDGSALLVNGLVMVGAVLTNQSPVSLADTTPIARLTGEYEVIVVPAASPLKTLGDLAAAMKTDIGKVSVGGGSAGGTDHILAGLVAQAAGADATKLNYVPFSGGGEALAAILGGHVTAGISGYGEWEGQIKSGELRALGISSGAKVEGVDIPTLKEQGIEVELANWRSVVAAPGISDDQKKALLDAVDAMHKSDAWKKVLADKKWLDLYMAGDDFGTFLKAENDRVTATLKTIGLVQ